MSRGVAPVISTILMVAVVVVLAAVLSVFALGFTEDVDDAAPVVGQSSGEFKPFDSGTDEQIVTIRHVAGDTIPVKEMEVAVSATCESGTKRSRLVALPVDGFQGTIGDANVQGADIFDKGYGAFGRGDVGVLDDDTFTAGEMIQFRIKKYDEVKDVGCTVPQDGEVTVRVVHVPTNAVVITQELTAR